MRERLENNRQYDVHPEFTTMGNTIDAMIGTDLYHYISSEVFYIETSPANQVQQELMDGDIFKLDIGNSENT